MAVLQAGDVVNPIVTEVAPKKPPTDGLSSMQSLLATVVIAVFVITFVVQAFQIPSESMENTLLIGDYLLVDKLRYGGNSVWDHFFPYRKAHRGDIIVFRYPVNPSQHFVKRVVGVPGDHIRLINRQVFVNEIPLQKPYVRYSSTVQHAFRLCYAPFVSNYPLGPHVSSRQLKHGKGSGDKESNQAGRKAARNNGGVSRFFGRRAGDRPVHHHFRCTGFRDSLQLYGEHAADWRSRFRHSRAIRAAHKLGGAIAAYWSNPPLRHRRFSFSRSAWALYREAHHRNPRRPHSPA